MTPTHLRSAQGTGSDTSITTTSITPGGQRLVLAWIRTVAATTPNIPTVSGNGITWVLVISAICKSAPQLTRISCFRAMGATPTPGGVVFDFAGQTQTEVVYSILDISGVDTTGSNGSGAVVQAVADSTTFSALNFTVTLGAFSSPNNATFGGFAEPVVQTLLPGSGFTTINAFSGGSGGAFLTEWRSDNDTTVDASSPTQDNWQAIALEIAPPAASTPSSEEDPSALFPGYMPDPGIVSVW